VEHGDFKMNSYPPSGSRKFQKLPVEKQKELLLDHYSKKPSTLFGQLDGYLITEENADDVMRPDPEGDFCSGGATNDLMHGANVRILIRKGTSRKDAKRLINKLVDWFERDAEEATGGVVTDLRDILSGINKLDEFNPDKNEGDFPF
jgi:hypothetical protein